jgi:hypothetical protein
MTPLAKDEEYTLAQVCAERHKAVDDRLTNLQSWVGKIDGKMWAGLAILALNFISTIVFLVLRPGAMK